MANPREGQRFSSRKLDPEVLRFLSQLSHELRTPLTGIKGSIGVVLANEPPGTSDPLRRMFQTIDAAADRMEHMIANVSELVRMQTGQSPLLREECNLDELLRRVVEQCRVDGQLRGRPVEVEVPKTAVMVNVDRARMERAVGNLVVAAVKLLGPEGSVKLTLRPGEPRCEMTVAAELPMLADGKAPPPLDQSAVAERMSLELAVASAIIERHGGHVSVENAASGGITLRLVVPRDESTTAASTGSEVRAAGL
jgi:two-component system sensor histidine kinase KdpD